MSNKKYKQKTSPFALLKSWIQFNRMLSAWSLHDVCVCVCDISFQVSSHKQTARLIGMCDCAEDIRL